MSLRGSKTSARGSAKTPPKRQATPRRPATPKELATPKGATNEASAKGRASAPGSGSGPAPGTDGPRDKALNAAIGDIEKSYGKGSIMRLGASILMAPVEGISTGSIGLDLALGGPGLPRGRVCEIYGPESSGKTTLTLHVAAAAQRAGGICAFVDSEHALDPGYARKLGVRLDDLLVSQPDTGEQGLEIVETLVRSNAVDLVVIDSVAALVPRAEIEGEMGDSFVGLHARLMSQGLRKLTGAISKSRCLVIFINQIREKIGVMFGSPETTTGGRALKFYSSVRLDIRRIGQLKDGDVVVGNRTKVTVVKNKVAPPFRKVEFDILYECGISREGELVDLGQQAAVVQKSGTWYSLRHPTDGEIRLGQGLERTRRFLVDNPDLAAVIEEAVYAKFAPPPAAGAPPEAPTPEAPAPEEEG